jgi:hypothetical protein
MIAVTGKVTITTAITCPECRVAFELDGDLDSCVVGCPHCNVELRVTTEPHDIDCTCWGCILSLQCDIMVARARRIVEAEAGKEFD